MHDAKLSKNQEQCVILVQNHGGIMMQSILRHSIWALKKQTRLILLAGSLFEEGILWLILRTSYQTGLPSWLGQQFRAKFHSVAWLSRAAVEVWMRSSLITFFCCAGQCYARLLGEKLKVKLTWIISSIWNSVSKILCTLYYISLWIAYFWRHQRKR